MQLLNALSTPEGRESDLYISSFARNGEEEKGRKDILWQRKVRKYFFDWFTPGKGLSIAFFRPIKHNNILQGQFIESGIYCIDPDCLIASNKSQGDYNSMLVFLTSNS